MRGTVVGAGAGTIAAAADWQRFASVGYRFGGASKASMVSCTTEMLTPT